jgi:hypothetical protein
LPFALPSRRLVAVSSIVKSSLFIAFPKLSEVKGPKYHSTSDIRNDQTEETQHPAAPFDRDCPPMRFCGGEFHLVFLMNTS